MQKEQKKYDYSAIKQAIVYLDPDYDMICKKLKLIKKDLIFILTFHYYDDPYEIKILKRVSKLIGKNFDELVEISKKIREKYLTEPFARLIINE